MEMEQPGTEKRKDYLKREGVGCVMSLGDDYLMALDWHGTKIRKLKCQCKKFE